MIDPTLKNNFGRHAFLPLISGAFLFFILAFIFLIIFDSPKYSAYCFIISALSMGFFLFIIGMSTFVENFKTYYTDQTSITLNKYGPNAVYEGKIPFIFNQIVCFIFGFTGIFIIGFVVYSYLN